MSAAPKIAIDQLPSSSTVRDVPVERTCESPFNHRGEAEYGDLDEFKVGIKEPGLARPRPGGPDKHGADVELVYAHRRRRGALKWKHPTIPLIVREMSDAEVIEAQLIEHIRKDPSPLSEAAAYEDLHQKFGRTVEQIASKVGRSVKYVRARLRLRTLCPAAVTAFKEGKIDIGRALVLVGLPDAAIQEEVLKHICDDEFNFCTLSEAQDRAMRHAMKLADAPFDPKDAELVKASGACTVCPHNTDVTTDLFGDLGKEGKATCTKPNCFDAKKQRFVELRIAREANAGKKVLDAKDAAKLFSMPARYDAQTGPKLKGTHVELDEKCELDPKGRTYGQLLGKLGKDSAEVAVDPAGNVHDVIPKAAAKLLLEDAGHHFKAPPTPAEESSWQVEERKRKEKEEQARAVGEAVLPTLLERIRATKLAVEDVLRFHLLFGAQQFWNISKDIREHYGIETGNAAVDKWIETAPIKKLVPFLLEWGARHQGNMGESFEEACRLHKIDLKAEAKKLNAAEKPAKAPKAEKKPAAKKARK